ncbi:MAG: S26 family signal peptidase [Candidatus Tectimicrobiota bacterium]
MFGPSLLLNCSPSVPRGLYVLTPLMTPTRGMLVVFPPPPAVAALLVRRGYLPPHTPLLKPVAALPGETVCVHDDGVVIQGQWVAPVAAVDTLGRPLPRWRGCVTLGADEVFPLSLAPRSLDGRYVGPVAVASLLGQAVPVWTWGMGAVRSDGGERGQDKGTPGQATLPKKNQGLGTRQAKIFPADRLQILFFPSLVPRHNAVAGEERGHAH